MAKKVGFIGIGMFATYTVRGLRNGGADYPIILSPRGAENAKVLADECNCEVAESNQDVIDNCDIIILCVRPEQFDEMANDLNVPAGKIIISAMAGITIDKLKSAFNGASEIYRTLPVCCSEAGAGLVPIYPTPTGEINDLLKPLGNVFSMKTEDEFTGASIGASMNGSLYGLYDEMVKWFEANGFDNKTARAIVLENVAGTVEYAKMKSDDDLGDICASIATPNTYTGAGYDALQNGNGLKSWSDCLDTIKDRFEKNK